MKFVGWIAAHSEDREMLKRLGCRGAMIYNEEKMCFEHCELSFWRVVYLSFFCDRFYPGAFTNARGNWQPFW